MDYQLSKRHKEITSSHLGPDSAVIVEAMQPARKTALQQSENCQKLQYRPKNL